MHYGHFIMKSDLNQLEIIYAVRKLTVWTIDKYKCHKTKNTIIHIGIILKLQ